MPTYEYRCDACGHEFEQFQSITASPIRKCPECGKLKVRRLVSSGAGVIFKGSGFWQTDYNRSDSYKKAAEKESSGGSSEPAKEAKPDAGEKSKSSATDGDSAASKPTTPDPGTSSADRAEKPAKSADQGDKPKGDKRRKR